MKHCFTELLNSSHVKEKGQVWRAILFSVTTMCAGMSPAQGYSADHYQLQMTSFALALSPEVSTAVASKYEFQITGTVRDDNGVPLPGVTVLVKGTSLGTSTNTDGSFTLSLPDEQSNGTLVFSFIGFATQEIPISGQRVIDVTMATDAKALEEVVVTGYGTQRKSDVTGSVGVVSSEELLKAPVTNALQGLQGKIAGVNVKLNSGSPTSSPRVVIRGVGTINSSSSPLYVVDGVVMEDIQFLNPNDIESIEVLKDASSTAIYGARGANGVILVTTRRGAATEGVVVGYDGFVSVGKMRKKMDLLNAEEWLQVVETGMANTPKYRPGVTPTFTKSDPRLFDASGNPLYDTDWQEEATRTAISHNHQLSLQTRGNTSSFGAFLNYAKMEGIMLNSWLERVNGKVAYDATPKKWLSVGVNLLVNYTRENEAEEGGGHQMPRRTMIEMPPIFPVKFPDGTWSNSSLISDAYNLEGMANPVHVLQTQDRLRDRTQYFGNTYLTFHLLPGLDLRTQFGFDKHNRSFKEYYPTDLLNISSPLGRAFIGDYYMNYWQEETFLSYNKELGDHRINSVLGLSWQERSYEYNTAEARGFADDFFRYHNMGAASQPGAPQSGYEKWSMNSYFLRGGYAYKDKYLLTLTGRVDGSSRFGKNNKYGFFPSLGVGWVVSNEPFLQNATLLDHLKFRSSYGVTGNTEIPTYQSLATVSSGTVLIGGERQTASFPSRMPNPDLKWERTKQFDVGFDARLFNNRVGLEFDYYYKLTTDLLLDRPIPHSTGFSSVRDNIGSVSNRGIEVMLTTTNIDNSAFRWESTLNFNYNKNRIEKLGENDEDIEMGPWWVSGSQTILRVGEPVSSFWGYERLGTWGTDEADEAAKVGAVPGEAKRAREKSILGKGLPDWTGSFINNFQYNNFDLSVDLQFVYGVDILQQFYHSTEDRSGIANGLRTILTEGWTPERQNTMVQEIRNQAYAGQNSEVDSRWVANGSYLRGNLISLGYNFDNTFLPALNLKALRVYASVQNAFVIHADEFQGYDPEATSWGGDQWGQNIFFFQYPRPRTYTLGLNVKF
ncbi:SusC/RagA family TonB-linked outer membrane protein [Pontibacter chinhatensis]|uniref:TonB-linked outer membrane protein, SusC/RagA family n=1 Tax=Pontibacter chinhatensis TaxID=1436961 RepID=A0A1I2PLW9_9BACT|nr:TonB-dependent receptor [Pontibacter chinhatensis]SFG16423.1 TonB-linked outer membrane protein, SusC/RagA family [Pontibacter chinhatensis]